MKKVIIRTLLLSLFIISSIAVSAYNLRQISSKDGLSNSAILSMLQDKNGEMWFGSCDGLNIFDGVKIKVYKNVLEKNNILSGNLIEKIIETSDDIYWIHTNYGLDKLDIKKNKIESYTQFSGAYFLVKSNEDNIFILRNDNVIHYYNKETNSFDNIKIDKLLFSDIINTTIDSNNYLWIFTKNKQTRKFAITESANGRLILKEESVAIHDKYMITCQIEGDDIYFVDDNYILYQYNLVDGKKQYLFEIKETMEKFGSISSIIKHNNNYFIGFATGGLVCLRNTPEIKDNYQIELIDIRSGIFCMQKDRQQDIVWIGTDGQGVFMYSEDPYTIRSVQFTDFTYQIRKPIRSIFLDKASNLWIGTKGDGILRIKDYQANCDFSKNKIDYLNTANGQFINNSVYAFAESDKNILWIGSDAGISYHSYRDNKIRHLPVNVDGEYLKYVHSISEIGDSVVWAATVGMGIVRINIKWNADTPSITGVKHYVINNGEISSNFFFTTYKDANSNMWFGNRGLGLYYINSKTGELSSIKFDKNIKNKTINDVFSITLDDQSNVWAGTSYGLVKYTPDGREYLFNEANGFPNNTVHGILWGDNNNLWLSTNQGIVNFSPNNETFQIYSRSNGLEITEFSDGAFFKDEASGALFFGGVDGFVIISENNFRQKDFLPSIRFKDLTIFGEEQNIYNFLEIKENMPIINLEYNQNFFTLHFIAIDYINGNNYNYFYQLEGINDQWIDNGVSNSVSFTNLQPGKYILLTKYKNRITGEESPVYPITIYISPPWYMSTFAYIVYALIIVCIIVLLIRMAIVRTNKNNELKMSIINQKHQEEVHESKLQFFTNIAHEFCTPLTLIYGPCNRILSHKGSDSFVLKYTKLIQRNAERLNSLIQELIEFRRIETGNKTPFIENISIDNLIYEETDSFAEMASQRNIRFERKIDDGLCWNTDKVFLQTIIINLLSNAFKYTTDNGNVCIEVTKETITDENDGQSLTITVSNTGKGIKEEDLKRIFDRYSILDDFERQNEKSFSRNGLGLAISNSMVKLLEGTIMVESTPNEWTNFIVNLPQLPVSSEKRVEESSTVPIVTTANDESDFSFELSQQVFDKFKPTILIIDDDKEILWLISEIFVDEYNVMAINNPDDVMTLLSEVQPNIILCDIMMPKISGIQLTKEIKSNPKTAHIPLILISAKNKVEEQIEGLEAGAEMYLTKPFNVDYLRTSVQHLINRKNTLKDYFSSPISAYELTDSKLTHKEHKKFMKQIYDIINKNLTKKELSPKFIADEMNMSTRHLYRRLKEIGENSSPADMIKECRLHVAQDLLLKTKLTIDEIIYKSGFSTRSTFFKVFDEKYRCTPKEFRENNTNSL